MIKIPHTTEFNFGETVKQVLVDSAAIASESITSCNNINESILNSLDHLASQSIGVMKSITHLTDMITDVSVITGSSNTSFNLLDQRIASSNNVVVDKVSMSMYLQSRQMSSHVPGKVYVETNGSDGNSVDFDYVKYANKNMVASSSDIYEVEMIDQPVSASIQCDLGYVAKINNLSFSVNEYACPYPVVTGLYGSEDGREFFPIRFDSTNGYSMDINNFINNGMISVATDLVNIRYIDMRVSQSSGYSINGTSKRRFAISIGNLRFNLTSSAEDGQIVFGPIKNKDEILKIAISPKLIKRDVGQKNITWEVSHDNQNWYRIDPAEQYDDQQTIKVISFNTLLKSSIKTEKPVREFYIKATIKGMKVKDSFSTTEYKKHQFTIDDPITSTSIPDDMNIPTLTVGILNNDVHYGSRKTSSTTHPSVVKAINIASIIMKDGSYAVRRVGADQAVNNIGVFTNGKIETDIHFSANKCHVERSSGFDVIIPTGADYSNISGFNESLPFMKWLSKSVDKSTSYVMKLIDDIPNGLYNLVIGDKVLPLDLRSGVFKSVIETLILVDVEKDVRLEDINGNLILNIPVIDYNGIKYVSLYDAMCHKYDKSFAPHFPIVEMKNSQYTIIDGNIISDYEVPREQIYAVKKTDIRLAVSTFDSDGIRLKSQDVKTINGESTLETYEGYRYAKLNHANIINGTIKVDLTDASINPFTKEVKFIDGNTEFVSDSKRNITLDKNSNWLKIIAGELKYFDESSMKIITQDTRLFKNRVYHRSELTTLGDWLLTEIDGHVGILLPRGINTSAHINVAVEFKIGSDIYTPGLFSVDYQNGYIYCSGIIDGRTKLNYLYTNVYCSYQPLELINRSEYNISGVTLSVKKKGIDGLPLVAISTVTSADKKEYFSSPIAINLTVNTITTKGII